MRFVSLRVSILAAAFLLSALLPLTALHAAGTFTVTNTNDSGAGSLRQAILAANAAFGGTIQFAIGSGPVTIQPITALPRLDYPTIVDGRTQPGYDGDPIVVLDGLSAPPTAGGISLYGGTLHSVVVTNFGAYNVGAGGTTVMNCIIGPDITGTHQVRQSENNLYGSGHFEGNLISGAYLANIFGGSQSVIRNNRIGTDITGNAPFHVSTSRGILGASASVIENNVFGNCAVGVTARYATGPTIRNNRFGIGRSGGAIGNLVGILIEESTGGPITGNVFANNEIAVAITSGSIRNPITGNSFWDNGIAIDLSATPYWGDGQTANDDGDGDVGGNNLTNFPVITRATSVGGSTTISGQLSSVPNREYTIELYASVACSSSGYGEGTGLLQSFSATTNASGAVTFERTFAQSLTPGYVVTATATSALDGTSEFSLCTEVEGTGTFGFASASLSVDEGESDVVTVNRSLGAAGAASVQYSMTDGTATAATSDYVASSGTLLFADGETSKTIPIQALADNTDEGASQNFKVVLSNATGATLGSPSTATVTIIDAQGPPAVIPPPDSVEVTEGNSANDATVVFHLSTASEVPQSFTYVTAAGSATGSDYVHETGTVTFAPGETEQSVVLSILGDDVWEDSEYFWIVWTYNGVTSNQAVVIVNDDPEPVVTVEDISVQETDGTVNAKIVLQALAPITGEIYYETVRGSATGDDYVETSGLVEFVSQMATIPLEIRGDDVTEGGESFSVRLYPSRGEFILDRDVIQVRILDDDIGVGPRTLSIPAGESRPVTIQVGDVTTADATFQLVSSNPAGISVPSTVVMAAGTSSVDFDITALAPGQDGIITVIFPAAAGGGNTGIEVSTYIGATLTFALPDGELYAGQTVNVRASLDPVAASPVTVYLSGGNERIELPSEVVIPAGGEATFPIKALHPGFFTIAGALPAQYGNESSSVSGRVLATPEHPVLLSVSPADGPVAGGTEVEVRGVLLRSDCTISFGNAAATSLHFVNSELLEITTPAHAAGAVNVSLHCGSDSDVLANGFLYRNAGATLSSVTPSSGSTSGGTFVRITGTGFVPSCWPLFGGIASPEARVEDAGNIVAVVPPHAAGAADVQLVCTGTDALLAGGFTFTSGADPLAQVLSIEPMFGSPGDVVTIRGTGLRLYDVITFGGIAARILESTPERHVVVVPDVPPGLAGIEINATGFGASATGPVFTVGEAAPPRVTAVGPASAAAGAEIELEGTGLRAPYTFAFGGKHAQIVTMSPWAAIVRLPADLAPGTYPTTVLNAGGQVASMGPSVTVSAEGVVIDRVSRRCAMTHGGLDVVISGKGFAAGATVAFDSVLATNLIFIDTTRIQARVPANAAGTATITITNPNGVSGTRTNALHYSSPFDPNPDCNDGRGRAVRH